MKRLDRFFKYWARLESHGTVSAFGRLERMALEIFMEWLIKDEHKRWARRLRDRERLARKKAA